MENKRKNFEENYVELVEFCKRENRLPQTRFGKEESRLNGFIQKYRDDIRIVEIREKYSKNKSFDENLQDLIKFCKRENRLPLGSHGKEEDMRLKGFMERYKKDPRVIEIREYYRRSFGKGVSKFEEGLKDLIEFCKKENRLPLQKFGKEENRLRGFMERYNDDVRIVEIREKYSRGGKSFNESLQDLIEFCERENRLPLPKFGKEEGRLKGFIQRYEKDPRIIAIKKKYSKYSKRGA